MTDAELRLLCAHATAGPWTDRRDDKRPDWRTIFGEARDVAHIPPWSSSVEVDACFIAAAREAVPRLLDENAHLRGLLALARDGAKEICEANPNTPIGVVSIYRPGLPRVSVQDDAAMLVESIDHTLRAK